MEMSLKKILFAAAVLCGAQFNPCMAEDMGAASSCSTKCTAQHCGTYKARAYDCGVTCPEQFEDCLSGIKDAAYVAGVRQKVEEIKASMHSDQ